jgi:SAM-dependent methyltransferase
MIGQVDNCPACGAVEHHIIVRLDPRRREALRAFDERKYGGAMSRWVPPVEAEVAGCRECGHAWYRHQPSDEQLSSMYEAGRPLSGAAPSQQPTAFMLAEMSRVRTLIGEREGRPSLLDYGSGFGRWARAAVSSGFAVTAFEPSMARSADPERPFEFVADASDLESRRFDVVQLEQVLEHVHEPIALLRRLRAHVTPSGFMRVTVPNILRAPEGARLWELWPYDGHGPHTLAPFEHLHGFTPRSLESVALRAGFAPVTDARVWRHYAVNEARRIAGRWVPAIGTTTLFIRPAGPGADA